MRTNHTMASALESIAMELHLKGEPAAAPSCERRRTLGLEEVQKRLEAARNEVARLEQEQDRMMAEGHGVLCECAYCFPKRQRKLQIEAGTFAGHGVI